MSLTPASNTIGKPFIELQTVDSTNKYAMQLVQRDHLTAGQIQKLHGLVIFAHEQTAGKGQRGKKWASGKGDNITLSVILNPYPLSLFSQFGLSVSAAVSMWEFFSKYAGVETRIKWPNDLYWRDRKAGGLLIESVVGSQESIVYNPQSRVINSELTTSNQLPITPPWKWAIAGIGININQIDFPADLPNPVSLKQITGKSFQPLALAKEFCNFFQKNFQLLLTGNFESLFAVYQTHLYKKNQKVKLKQGSRVFETTIKGVSETGQLITQHSIEERFDFGEVDWLI